MNLGYPSLGGGGHVLKILPANPSGFPFLHTKTFAVIVRYKPDKFYKPYKPTRNSKHALDSKTYQSIEAYGLEIGASTILKCDSPSASGVPHHILKLFRAEKS